MAILKKTTINNDILEDLYYKILSVSKYEDSYIIKIGVFKSKEDSKDINNMLGYGEDFFSPNLSDKNLIAQAYSYIKLNTSFKDSIDA